MGVGIDDRNLVGEGGVKGFRVAELGDDDLGQRRFREGFGVAGRELKRQGKGDRCREERSGNGVSNKKRKNAAIHGGFLPGQDRSSLRLVQTPLPKKKGLDSPYLTLPIQLRSHC